MDSCCPSLSELTDIDLKPNKLTAEIECGINIRRNRNQEKDIVLATHDPSYLYEQVRDKRGKKRRRRKHKLICHPEIPAKPTLNRFACTFKEYIDFLSIPRNIYKKPVEPKRKRDTGNKTVSPRFAQLAIPLKRRILCSWINYLDVLSPEQILFLKELLYKEEGLSLAVAKGYFKRLDATKRAKRKARLRKLKCVVLKKPEKSKVVKEIHIIAKRIIRFFAKKCMQDVKYSHMMITDLIRLKLVNNNLIQPYKRSNVHDACGQCFFETVDQLSVWLETNICYADEDELEGDMAGSMMTSSGSTFSEIPVEEMEEEEEEQTIDVGPLSVSHIDIEEELETTVEEIEEIEKEMEAMAGTGEGGGSGGEGKDKVVKDVEEAEAFEVDIQKEVVAFESSEPSEPSDGIDATDLCRGILDDLLNSIMDKEGEEEEAVPEEAEEALHIEEHSPDAVCCVTLKTWATWLVTVAQNTHSWCQWIQDVIAKIRFFAAVLKGEIKTKDGKKRILYKEEWVQFKENLDNDIKAWLEYKAHVTRISEKIIDHCQNKRIICCKACLDSKLIISAETAHQVTEQLVEALETTAYWRNWLDAVVAEANKLAALDLDLPTTPEGTSIESGSMESYGVFDIVEIKSPSSPSEESSDTSVYIIEEI